MLEEWQRLETAGMAVYVHPEKPDWFVPDAGADRCLAELRRCDSPDLAACAMGAEETSLAARLLTAHRLASQLAPDSIAPYHGRAEALSLTNLKECWIHLTDRCNLACRHCLFASSPAQAATLPRELLAQAIAEAKDLGCTLFYFTGGEPFLYEGFPEILAELLRDPLLHAVVLSNGLLIGAHLASLAGLPKERLHLQLSLDGRKEQHEALRGAGTFARLQESLDLLKEAGFNATLSVAVNRANVLDLAELVAFAGSRGVRNIHLLWHFVRGKGSRDQFVPPEEILPELIRAQAAAQIHGVLIDNVETLKSQIFSSPGTRFDLANTAWESLAVGPDANIYPSPALVGIPALACGNLRDGLAQAWRHSPVLKKIRRASLIDSEAYRKNPLKFIIGGGDIDHSFLAGGDFVGHDPYVPLYNGLALWLIAEQARQYPGASRGGLLLRMGDVRHDCPEGGPVSLTHCNCVISLSDDLGHSTVREFYAAAALTAKEDIANPFAPAQALATFIPAESRKKSYGCGSPVQDAAPRSGEVLVDLGSGSGVECFLAAAEVGPRGRVYGIDMTDEMLNLANKSKKEVIARLGYDNLEFKKGFLEALPLADNCADVVISNCVINLSPDKRRTFHEVFRVLKPGGRMVVSDIVTDRPIPVRIRNNEKFRGECLGGALLQEDLLAMLRGCGFSGARLVKRFPYRREGGVQFYSLTFRVVKPVAAQEVEVIYRGPFSAAHTESGALLLAGKRTRLSLAEAEGLGDSVFILAADGAVTNVKMENSCCPPSPAGKILPMAAPPPIIPPADGCDCTVAPKGRNAAKIVTLSAPGRGNGRHQSGCMACGREITYLHHEEAHSCYYCGGAHKTSAICTAGHFICDDCHQEDGLSAIRVICTETGERDMLALLAKIRRHPAVPMHGPEHHAMVPGIILATYRNRGGAIGKESILTGIERGSKVPGGVCGFWGNCGAATGVGIAYSVLLAATPLTPQARQLAQEITSRVLGEIAHIKGARCCQRETVTALREAAVISHGLLPTPLLAEADFYCRQFAANRECIRGQCPLWKKQETELTAER
ncbi:DUF5714 domain-containing protein [Thiovibrio sp. JS02]